LDDEDYANNPGLATTMSSNTKRSVTTIIIPFNPFSDTSSFYA